MRKMYGKTWLTCIDFSIQFLICLTYVNKKLNINNEQDIKKISLFKLNN